MEVLSIARHRVLQTAASAFTAAVTPKRPEPHEDRGDVAAAVDAEMQVFIENKQG